MASERPLISQLSSVDRLYFEHFRMTKPQFMRLLSRIKPFIINRRSKYHLLPRHKLSLCLKFLTSGKSIPSLAQMFNVSVIAAYKVITDVCFAINKRMLKEVLPGMKNKDWVKASDDFWEKCSFPNCVGALKGRRIPIAKNAGEPSAVVLFGIVDANYKFLALDVGPYTNDNGDGVFRISEMGQKLEEGKLCIPKEQHLPGTDVVLPYVLVGSEGFPLKTNLLTPYMYPLQLDETGLEYNRRLKTVRKIGNQGFNMLTHRFRVYDGGINLERESAMLVIRTTVILHNFIYDCINGHPRRNYEEDDIVIDSALQYTLRRRQRFPKSAINVRDCYASYFCSPVGNSRWREENIYM